MRLVICSSHMFLHFIPSRSRHSTYILGGELKLLTTAIVYRLFGVQPVGLNFFELYHKCPIHDRFLIYSLPVARDHTYRVRKVHPEAKGHGAVSDKTHLHVQARGFR